MADSVTLMRSRSPQWEVEQVSIFATHSRIHACVRVSDSQVSGELGIINLRTLGLERVCLLVLD
jgi:hypothetical protein